MATNEQLTAQLVDMHKQLADVINRLGIAERLLLSDDKKRSDYNESKEPVDKKFFTPVELTVKTIFKEWAEDFVDFVESRDELLGDELRKSADSAVFIISLGENPEEIAGCRRLYRILKRLVQPHPEAKALVTITLNKNV